MTGKEILISALKRMSPERVPWVPFAGVHAGSLIGATPDTYLKDADLIVKGIQAVCERYLPDGVPIVFDLQVEAEILGCDLEWSAETPPAVKTHPLANGGAIDTSSLPPYELTKGRMPLILDATRRLKEAIGDNVGLYGLITGPLTLALHLRSAEFFMDMFYDPDAVIQLLDYCADIACKTAAAYIEAGADVIAVVDPMISQISAEHFTQFVSAPLNKVFDAVASMDKLSSLFVCGDATRNLEVMCETHCDNISVDENVDLSVLKDVALKASKSFGGNMRLTTTLLMGDEIASQKDAIECLDKGGTQSFILAPGCDLPYAVPAANMEAVAKIVHDPYQLDVARNIPVAESTDSFDDIPLPEYSKLDEIIIDVVTLDSSACAPCQYMVLAAKEASEMVDTETRVVEHKISSRDGLAYMTKLGIKAIPSLCIQGNLVYASIIPDSKTLAQAIRSASRKK